MGDNILVSHFYRVIKPIRYVWLLLASSSDLECNLITDEAMLHEAKLLHANTYIRKGYVTREVLDARGLLSKEEDPYQDHSVYFAVTSRRSGKVVAASRLIVAPPETSLSEFQTLAHMQLFDRSADNLSIHATSSAVEVSALVKDTGASSRAVLMLYRAMWQHSVAHRHSLWLFTCNAELYKRLEYLFGDAIEKLGPNQKFHGHDFVPAALDVSESIGAFARGAKSTSPSRRIITKRVAKFFVRGLPEDVKGAHVDALRDLAV